MKEQFRLKIAKLSNLICSAQWELEEAIDELNEFECKIKDEDELSIKNINAFKRELKRDGLFTNEIETFLENYMKYYNY